MKLSRGRGRILVVENDIKSVEVVDGYYTEDCKYFIYKGKIKWYMMDVDSGLSYGRSKSYLTKKDLEKDIKNIIPNFDKVRTINKTWYNKVSKYYKQLCREYDLKVGRI